MTRRELYNIACVCMHVFGISFFVIVKSEREREREREREKLYKRKRAMTFHAPVEAIIHSAFAETLCQENICLRISFIPEILYFVLLFSEQQMLVMIGLLNSYLRKRFLLTVICCPMYH